MATMKFVPNLLKQLVSKMVKFEYKEDGQVTVRLSKGTTVKELDNIISSLLEARSVLVESLRRASEEGTGNLWECHD